jgi:chemotaxis protein CheX
MLLRSDMRVEFVAPFYQAAGEVLESELGAAPDRGQVAVRKSPRTSHDVTAILRVVGSVSGVVLIAMNEPTALAMVGRMMGEECAEFDELAQSGIGELGNVITGRAAVLLAEAGFPSDITPPQLVVGRGTAIAGADQPLLVMPLQTEVGQLEIHVGLQEAKQAAVVA